MLSAIPSLVQLVNLACAPDVKISSRDKCQQHAGEYSSFSDVNHDLNGFFEKLSSVKTCINVMYLGFVKNLTSSLKNCELEFIAERQREDDMLVNIAAHF